MLKVISSDAWKDSLWSDETPRSALIKCSSRGVVDRKSFVKRACASSDELLDKFASMEKKPGEEYVHLIGLGSTEAYGPNRNGDGFSEAACRKYHPTFVKDARVYRDHKNTDKTKSYGIVKASAFNEAMSRVELIVALNATEAAAKANKGLLADKEMEKLAAGKDLPVSMACLTNPDYPILTRDKGYVPIKDIQVGDLVWTKDSGWKPVTALNRRRYTGQLCELHVTGLPFPLELTADHLMWAKCLRSDNPRKEITRFFAGDSAEAGPEWVPAEKLQSGDYLFYRAVSRHTAFGALDDTELAAVLGYYMAEGYVSFCKGNPNTVAFACNVSDSLPRKVPKYLHEMWPEITVSIRPHRSSAQGLVVSVYSAELARFVNKLIRTGSHDKIVPPEISNARREVQLAFLGAWIDGDGYVDDKGAHISTCSRSLALQARDLGMQLGYAVSIYCIDHTRCATSGMKNSGVEFQINFAKPDLAELAAYSDKISSRIPEVTDRERGSKIRTYRDGFFAYKIKEIRYRAVTDIQTYNFEVADDPSYSAAGLISHNCSVPYDVCSFCGNKAQTTAEYCTGTHEGGKCRAGGLKHNMGKIASVDGKLVQLYADNTRPSFFDISHVFVPADRIAYSSGRLTKQASAGTPVTYGGAELARQLCVTGCGHYMEDPEQVHALQLLKRAVADFHARRLWEKRASFLSVLNHIPLKKVAEAKRYSFDAVQKAFQDLHVCLTPSQFVQLTGELPLEKAAQLGEIIAPLSNDFLEKCAAAQALPKPAVHAPEPLFHWAAAQGLPSIHPDRFFKQAALAAVSPAPDFTLSPEEVYALGEDPSIRKLAAQYALYKAAFVANLPSSLRETAAELLVGRDYTGF